MSEFVFADLLITPLVRYALIAAVVMVIVRPALSRLRIHRWLWNPLLAEAAAFVCLVAALNLLLP